MHNFEFSTICGPGKADNSTVTKVRPEMLQYRTQVDSLGVEKTQLILSRCTCLKMTNHAEAGKLHLYEDCM